MKTLRISEVGTPRNDSAEKSWRLREITVNAREVRVGINEVGGSKAAWFDASGRG